jgi:hypothetical protein
VDGAVGKGLVWQSRPGAFRGTTPVLKRLAVVLLCACAAVAPLGAINITVYQGTFVLSNEAPGHLIDQMIAAGYGSFSLYDTLVAIQADTDPSVAGILTPPFLAALQNCPAAAEIFTIPLRQFRTAAAVAVSTDGTARVVSVSGSAFSPQAAGTLPALIDHVGPALFTHSSDLQTPLTSISVSGPLAGMTTVYRVFAVAYTTAAPSNCPFETLGATSGAAAAAHIQFAPQGNKLVGAPATGAASQGCSVALSADGNTAIVGGLLDNVSAGAAWIFNRTGANWNQQPGKLNDAQVEYQGYSVAISADGNTAMTGGYAEPLLIFARSNGLWNLQAKLGSYLNEEGISHVVALSGDGNTALVGAPFAKAGAGSVTVYRRSGATWTQQAALTGTGGAGPLVEQGFAVALSADGSTAAMGGPADNSGTGAVWVFTRSGTAWTRQGNKLVGGAAAGPAQQGRSVALSGDGNTLMVGGPGDNGSAGAAWVFTRTNGVWSQQGGKLTGSGAVGLASQGCSVSISSDGNRAIVGGNTDNNNSGAAWVFSRSGGVWTQQAKLTGSGAVGAAYQGTSVTISGDGSTVILGGPGDNSGAGAAWAFLGTTPVATAPAPVGATPASGSGTTGTFTFTFSDTGGWRSLTVVDVLVRDVLDGRQACYAAFVPSGANEGSVYLVDDAGDAGGPYAGMVLPGSGSVANSQCGITGAGSSLSGSGNILTLTLAMTFTPGFAGNKVMYLAAQDGSGSSGWHPLGVWNVPGAAVSGPSVSGMSPGRSTTSPQTYTFTFSDTMGWQDLAVANVLINNAIDGRNACYVAFVPAGAGGGAVYLVDNAGDAGGPYAGMVLPGTGSVSNSQCAIAGATSSASASGNTLALTLAITFSHGFTGNRVFYLAARSGTQNSGWQAVGTVGVE